MPLREYALTSNAQQRLCCSIGIEPRTISNNPNALPEIAIDRTSFAIRSDVIRDSIGRRSPFVSISAVVRVVALRRRAGGIRLRASPLSPSLIDKLLSSLIRDSIERHSRFDRASFPVGLWLRPSRRLVGPRSSLFGRRTSLICIAPPECGGVLSFLPFRALRTCGCTLRSSAPRRSLLRRLRGASLRVVAVVTSYTLRRLPLLAAGYRLNRYGTGRAEAGKGRAPSLRFGMGATRKKNGQQNALETCI